MVFLGSSNINDIEVLVFCKFLLPGKMKCQLSVQYLYLIYKCSLCKFLLFSIVSGSSTNSRMVASMKLKDNNSSLFHQKIITDGQY